MEIGSVSLTVGLEYLKEDPDEKMKVLEAHQEPKDMLVLDRLVLLINSLTDFTNLVMVRRATQEYDYLQVFDRTPDWGHLNLLQLVLRSDGHQTVIQLMLCCQRGQRVVKEEVMHFNLSSPSSEFIPFSKNILKN